MHYENILGSLEVQFSKSSLRQWAGAILRQSYHGLYSWLVELVYHLSFGSAMFRTMRLSRGRCDILRGLPALQGKRRRYGFFRSITTRLSNVSRRTITYRLIAGSLVSAICLCGTGLGSKVGELPIDTLAVERLERTGFDFKNLNKPGINLIKIHGALDAYSRRTDSRDLIKARADSRWVSGVLESLRAANEQLVYVAPSFPDGKAKALNEITYADESGEMQFLRKTILSGAYKFDRRSDSGAAAVYPQSVPRLFKSRFALGLYWLRVR